MPHCWLANDTGHIISSPLQIKTWYSQYFFLFCKRHTYKIANFKLKNRGTNGSGARGRAQTTAAHLNSQIGLTFFPNIVFKSNCFIFKLFCCANGTGTNGIAAFKAQTTFCMPIFKGCTVLCSDCAILNTIICCSHETSIRCKRHVWVQTTVIASLKPCRL